MTIQITPKKRIFKEFELPDVIPYAIAAFMLWGSVYMMLFFTHVRL